LDRPDLWVFSHLGATGNLGPNDSRFGTGDVADIRRYIKLGPLGQSFGAEEMAGAGAAIQAIGSVLAAAQL
jgi:hypothetical protein